MATLLMYVFCLGLVLPVNVSGLNNTLPSTCESDAECAFLWPNSECNMTDGVCECAGGFCVNRNGYYCEKVKIGTRCPAGPDGFSFCRSGVTGAICDFRYGVCRCPDGYGNVAGDGFNRCAAAMKVSACQTCISTGGTCQDLDADGTPDRCGCPYSFTSSDPENSLATGCDLKEVPTGGCCSAEGGEIKCADPDAECTYANDLSVYHYCTCKLGYVAVPRDYDPAHADCRQIINEVLDPECRSCVRNGGTCYTMNENKTMDGCLCPPTRSSSAPGPEFSCDTNHIRMSCSLEDPTICFIPDTHLRFAYIVDLLVSGESKLYVRDHADNDYCQFRQTEQGFCIRQSEAVAYCGSESKEHKSFMSHATWMVLQYNAKYVSPRDICIYAYCRYETFAKVSTSEVIVAERKLISSDGFYVKPSLTMVASDKFGVNVEIGGIKLGDQLKLKITLTDTKGIYTSLRTETCIVSNHASLNAATTIAVTFIQDSCPKENSFLSKGTNFFSIVGDQFSVETGYFTVPKFATSDILFFHCAIRVCIDPKSCEPVACFDTGSFKRSVRGPITLPKSMNQLVTYRLSKRSVDSSSLDANQALESPDLARKTIGVKVLTDESGPRPVSGVYSKDREHEHMHPSEYDRAYDDYYDSNELPAPAREEYSFTVMIAIILASVLATFLLTTIVCLICYTSPRCAGRPGHVNTADIAE